MYSWDSSVQLWGREESTSIGKQEGILEKQPHTSPNSTQKLNFIKPSFNRSLDRPWKEILEKRSSMEGISIVEKSSIDAELQMKHSRNLRTMAFIIVNEAFERVASYGPMPILT
ncbi:hypothetical protein LXL04_029530 [Taraxacum kok-saghyz]